MFRKHQMDRKVLAEVRRILKITKLLQVTLFNLILLLFSFISKQKFCAVTDMHLNVPLGLCLPLCSSWVHWDGTSCLTETKEQIDVHTFKNSHTTATNKRTNFQMFFWRKWTINQTRMLNLLTAVKLVMPKCKKTDS